MNAWMMLWKVVFVVSIAVFGVMSIWVIIWGAKDIKKLLKSIRENHGEGDQAA